MSMVLDLQKHIISNEKTPTELLREALLISHKLKLDDFKNWIDNELKGYSSDDNISNYRILAGTLKFWNPYNGWIPAQYTNKKLEDFFSNLFIYQSIAELENLIQTSEDGTLNYPLSGSQSKELMKIFTTDLEPTIFLSLTQIVGIIEKVKTTLLEWTIELEENQILGDENMSFSNEEQDKAQKNIHIEKFYGVMGNVDNLGNLSTGDYNQNTTTINNNINSKINELIEKIDTLDIFDKSQIIQEIEENRDDKGKLTEILGQLMTRGSEIATVAPAIGELLGMLG